MRSPNLDYAAGGSADVRKYQDYLRHAAECRDMARAASPNHRQQLEQMAEVWEQLAEARRRKLKKQGKSIEADATEFE